MGFWSRVSGLRFKVQKAGTELDDVSFRQFSLLTSGVLAVFCRSGMQLYGLGLGLEIP